jgi:hypothetical protein
VAGLAEAGERRAAADSRSCAREKVKSSERWPCLRAVGGASKRRGERGAKMRSGGGGCLLVLTSLVRMREERPASDKPHGQRSQPRSISQGGLYNEGRESAVGLDSLRGPFQLALSACGRVGPACRSNSLGDWMPLPLMAEGRCATVLY